MIEWILENKNWVFSGIGVFLFTIIISLVRKFFLNKKYNYDEFEIQGNNNDTTRISKDNISKRKIFIKGDGNKYIEKK